MTAIACPCCRATNETGPNCRRCKADIGVLFAALERRDYLIARAECAAQSRAFEAAHQALAEAEQLKPGADVQRLRASIYLLAGDFPAAWGEYCNIIPNPAPRP